MILIKRKRIIQHLVLDKYKICYTGIPQVACTTFQWWIAALEGVDEAIMRSGKDSRESDPDLVVYDLLPKVAPHICISDANTIRQHAASGEYLIFAVVRNPFQRAFSVWQSKILYLDPLLKNSYKNWAWQPLPQSRAEFMSQFEEYLRMLASPKIQCREAYSSLQRWHLHPNLKVYNYIAKLEEPETLRQALLYHGGDNFPDVFGAPRVSESLIPYHPDYFTEEARKLVLRLYQEDFTTFSYDDALPLADRPLTDGEFAVALQGVEKIRRRHCRLDEVAGALRVRLNEMRKKNISLQEKLTAYTEANCPTLRPAMDLQIIDAAIPVEAETELQRIFVETHGKLRYEEGRLLYYLACSATDGCIVEIGSYQGKSTSCLALGARTHNTQIYACDPHQDFTGVGGGSFGPQDRVVFFENMLANQCADIVSLINLDSKRITAQWDQPVSLLFIDGDHAYQSVFHDFLSWKPHLSENAFVAFHDVHSKTGGPRRVVREILLSGDEFSCMFSLPNLIVLQRNKTAEA